MSIGSKAVGGDSNKHILRARSRMRLSAAVPTRRDKDTCLTANLDKVSGTCRIYVQGVPGGKDLTSGECSLGQTIPI